MAMRGTDQFVAMDMSDPPIDFAGVARSMGVESHCVTEPADLARVLQEAIASGRPNLVEVIVADGFGH